MVKQTGSTLRYYLDFNVIIKQVLIGLTLFASISGFEPVSFNNIRYNRDLAFNNPGLYAPDSSMEDSIPIFHARPLLLSLVVPGLGQYYNKAPLWKTALFAGIEIAGIVGYWQWANQGELLRIDFEDFADEYWSLENYAFNTPSLGAIYPVITFEGTHSLSFFYNDQKYESDDLATMEYNSGMKVVRDRDFYENIGKYDYFVSGWDDAWKDGESLIIPLKKDVGDSTEIILMTVNKEKYLDMRAESNTYLKMANYAVSSIMFNHVISAVEAVFSSRKNAEKMKQSSTRMGLIYDKKSKYGIGGIALHIML